MAELIIGKIPSYNSKIRGNSGIDYDNRLLSNLTITSFTPIGYSIDLFGNSGSIYKLGSNIKPVLESGKDAYKDIVTNPDGINIVNTFTALTQWQKMQSAIKGNVGQTTVYDSFKVISTNDSTVTESLSNSYGESMLSQPFGGNSVIGKYAQGLTNLATLGTRITSAMDSTSALSVLSSMQSYATAKGDEFGKQYGQAMSVLFGRAIGIQSAFPKIWSRSSYNNTTSLTIKLVSPSGHPDDVDNFVIKPLMHILLAASPVTFDGITYGFPPLWNVESKGVQTSKLAGISMVSISRGGPDTLFNRYNQPTNIDVRIVVEPVVEGFATPMSSDITDDIDASTGATKMLVQNPLSIIKPMLNKNIIANGAIELKSLSLTD